LGDPDEGPAAIHPNFVMSIAQEPKPAKLIIGMIMQDRNCCPFVARNLSRSLGAVDMVSRWYPFTETDYYKKEMGSPLFRRLIGFRELIQQDALGDVKGLTNVLEGQLTQDGKRTVNIDPGYLLGERFVLATGKNYAHRICIGGSVFADLTLIYRRGGFRSLEWTYPDYAGKPVLTFLTSVRDRYLCQMRELSNRVSPV
jgi:hypothetical protein